LALVEEGSRVSGEALWEQEYEVEEPEEEPADLKGAQKAEEVKEAEEVGEVEEAKEGEGADEADEVVEADEMEEVEEAEGKRKAPPLSRSGRPVRKAAMRAQGLDSLEVKHDLEPTPAQKIMPRQTINEPTQMGRTRPIGVIVDLKVEVSPFGLFPFANVSHSWIES
jgi:archaellum component FlaD/FlaE